MKFKILLVVYLGILVISLLLFSFDQVKWMLLGVTLVFFTVLLYGITTIRSNFFVNALNHAKPGTVVLTFDDGPHPENTPKILNVLKAFDIKAHFFLIGKNVLGHEDLVKRILAEGHIIGNHSFSHDLSFTFSSTEKVLDEIQETNAVVRRVCGQQVKWFRPPFGITNPKIAQAIQNSGMGTMGWDIRPKDTNYSNEEELLKKMIRLTGNKGGIILLHDRLEVTAKVLEKYINHCLKKGMKFGIIR